MSCDEFQLIRRYFAGQSFQHPDVVRGIGDDAAIVQIPPSQQLVVSMDTLVAGVHFSATDNPMDIGYKSLAVNLSDLAAMGAMPTWMTLSVSMPEADESWIKAFCIGLFSLAQEHDVQLIGGDTTRGPLSITLQIHGYVPKGTALRRDTAKPGDHILVTGMLGDAALALHLGTETCPPSLLERLRRPAPRLEQGMALRGVANSLIDISDGLLADLGHILEASQVGACIDCSLLPLSESMLAQCKPVEAWQYALSGGDDYELCLTVPDDRLEQVLAMNKLYADGFTAIGRISPDKGLRCQNADGDPIEVAASGYNHFTVD